MTDSSKISPIYCLSFYIRSSQRLHTVTWAPLFPSHRHDALVSPPYSRRCAVCSFPYLSSMLCPTLPRPSVFSPPPPSLHASPSLVATSSSPARSLLKSNNYTINWPSLHYVIHQSLLTPWTVLDLWSLRLLLVSAVSCQSHLSLSLSDVVILTKTNSPRPAPAYQVSSPLLPSPSRPTPHSPSLLPHLFPFSCHDSRSVVSSFHCKLVWSHPVMKKPNSSIFDS